MESDALVGMGLRFGAVSLAGDGCAGDWTGSSGNPAVSCLRRGRLPGPRAQRGPYGHRVSVRRPDVVATPGLSRSSAPRVAPVGFDEEVGP